MILPNIVENQ